MARSALICLALVAAICVSNAQVATTASKPTAATTMAAKPAATEAAATTAAKPAATAAVAPAAAAETTAAAAPAAAAGTTAAAKAGSKDIGGLDKTVQDAVSRAAQMAAEDVIARGGTKEQANAAGAKAAATVLASAKSGKITPTGTMVTPTVQGKVSAAAEKAARDVIAKGGTQAQANAAGAKAAQAILQQYQFSG